MNATVEFRQTSATTADLRLSYPVGQNETGSEFYTYTATKPENVIKEKYQVTTKAGRKIQLGIQVRNGSGFGVAWPVEEEDEGNRLEAELAERESKADEEAAEEPQSRVGKVFIDSEGTFYRVKKTKSGYLVTQEWYGDTWGRSWGYSTSTWRTPTAEEAKAFGDSTHHCVFCHKGLTTKESKAVGYGPVCADNYGLPWGE